MDGRGFNNSEGSGASAEAGNNVPWGRKKYKAVYVLSLYWHDDYSAEFHEEVRGLIIG
jgi:hypothetical protein